MGNSMLDKIHRFNRIMESEYVFTPGKSLVDILSQLPFGKALLFDPNNKKSNDVRFLIIDDNSGGVRIKVGDHYVYLALGHFTNEDFRKAVLPIHMHLMHIRMYYPAEEDLKNYWTKPDDQYNKSEEYANETLFKTRSKYLGEIIQQHCKNSNTVLEIGCNIGRNLFYLKSELKMDVAAIEISQYAVDQMPKQYPVLQDTKIYVGDVKEVIREIPDSAYDVVYSMAVLMHLHPTTPEEFWEDVVRVAGKYIVTIENERTSSDRHWGRNYNKVFLKYNVKEVFCERQGPENNLDGYVTRVFRVNK